MVDGIDIEPIAEGGGIALTIGTETALIASEHVPNLVAAIRIASRARAVAVPPSQARMGQLVRFEATRNPAANDQP
ncbi:hypothetical protein [Mycolicibacterium llatzerense]|uniref:Uncharacterized protein n=1 Tax=Mycolicibacterium llatzerense TaxID=280871 RepID=A0A0D1L009_9MYCO|nr:hypothetical protein [Mycolicibacterium llatzerense]KIU14415.1 hypothetical protein TL10_24315 [Mycolicibacterium llatzerense]MCT7371445.1 hypothetical protein [Mycolicibacterium llatzerense]